MKLRDLLKVVECDEFIFAIGEQIIPVRTYMGESLDPYLDMEVTRVRAYDNGFDIYLVAA